MPTLNIYIPDTLKQEVDQLDRNWSAICQSAIREEILSARATSMDYDAIATRVSAAGSAIFAAGYDAGKAYAAEYADIDDFEFFQSDYATLRRQCRYADELINDIEKSLKKDRECLFGDEEDISLRFIDGFSKGMNEIWTEISEKINSDF